MRKPKILSIGSLPVAIERELDHHYAVVRAPTLADVSGALLAEGEAIEAVVTGGSTGLPIDMMLAMPSLGLIAVNGVGLDRVDVEAARARGIAVTITSDVLIDDVAELAMAFILNLSRDILTRDRYVRSGDWERAAPLGLARRVAGRRLGILGLGGIGEAIARRAEAFGMQISYHNRRERTDIAYPYYPDPVALAEANDVLVVAVTGGASTAGLVTRRVLDAIGPDGILVNVARGSAVDEAALVAALEEGTLGFAGLDVFEREPEVPEALRTSDKVLLQPHQGSATVEARHAMGQMVLDSLAAYFAVSARSR